MPTTPIYAIPYEALSDPPDGAGLGQNGFLAVEAQLSRIDAKDTTQDGRLSTLETSSGLAVKGVIGGTRYTSTGTFTTGISGTEALTNMATPAVTLAASREYRIRVKTGVVFGAASQQIILRVRDTNLAGTIRGEHRVTDVNFITFTYEFTGVYVTTVTESKAFVVTAQVAGTTAPGANIVSVSGTTWVEVVDVGPSGLVTVSAGP